MAHIRTDLSTGRRVYVQTRYGEPIVAELKGMGAKWDPELKCWWVGRAKQQAVENLLVATDQAEDVAREKGEPTPKQEEDVSGCRVYASETDDRVVVEER